MGHLHFKQSELTRFLALITCLGKFTFVEIHAYFAYICRKYPTIFICLQACLKLPEWVEKIVLLEIATQFLFLSVQKHIFMVCFDILSLSVISVLIKIFIGIKQLCQ